MKYVAVVLAALLLQACAVNVVTVNVNESDLGYVDQGTGVTIAESNVK